MECVAEPGSFSSATHLHYYCAMRKSLLSVLFLLFIISCSGPSKHNDLKATISKEKKVTDSAANPVEWYRVRTNQLAEEKSLYEKYRIASENVVFFQKKKMYSELGRNLDILGNVMAQMEDSVKALDYYDRAAECYKKTGSAEDIYRNEIFHTNALPDAENIKVYQRLLNDSVVKNNPALHILALKGAYLCTDSLPLLDSCLAVLDRNRDIMQDELPVLLAMRIDETLMSGNLDSALKGIPRIRKETALHNPIAQHNEMIHVALARIYNEAGMKDSCIYELLQVIFWTDSAYREANLPAIYSRETRNMIEMADSNRRLEKRNIILWYVVSCMLLLGLLALILIRAKRRQSRSKAEIELLDARMENLKQLQTAQAIVMEENKHLVDEIEGQLLKYSENNSSCIQLADEIHKILNLYKGTDHKRQGFLKISKEIDPGFYSSLKEDFPNLSDGQLQLAALIAAGTDSHQLASILNISNKSLYTGRYRLRTSLKLTKSESLEDFLRKYTNRKSK